MRNQGWLLFVGLMFVAVTMSMCTNTPIKNEQAKENPQQTTEQTQTEKPSSERASTKEERTPTEQTSTVEPTSEPAAESVAESIPDVAPKESVVEKPPMPDTTPAPNVPVIGGCPIFPADNPWNTDISKQPVDPNSDALIASIGANTSLHPDFGTEWNGAPNGIPFVVVPAGQKGVNVTFQYADESDKGPYPVPKDAPIEGGPNGKGDRHVLVLQKTTCKLFELFSAFPQADGSWKAGSGAIFDLNSNKLRPDKWTSADAAGLPILPGLVKYEEVMAGEIKHALRFTVVRSRRAFVHPATHWASTRTDASLPPMGMRVRLKANVDISGYSKIGQVIMRAMKKYGMFVADNGSNWYVSGAPHEKWDDDKLRDLKKLKGKDFEVVKMGKIYTPANTP